MSKIAIVLAALLLAASPAAAETVTNDQVVALSHAGLGADAIVAKIRASASRFDVSTDALVALKGAGVADPVIAAMVVAAAHGGAAGDPADQSASPDPAQPHAAGLYLLETAPTPWMQRLDPTLPSDTTASSIAAWLLTYGVIPLKVTAVLAGPTARFKADTPRPTFYLFYNQPGSGLYQNGLGEMRLPGPTPAPEEFTLVRFQTAGGARKLLTQQIGLAGVPRGGSDASKVSVSYAVVAPGVFALTPDGDLASGEYAFVVTPDEDTEHVQDRYFDFSVGG
jgi:hypothetical protein